MNQKSSVVQFLKYVPKALTSDTILNRNLELDETWFADLLRNAEEVDKDPLEKFLAFLELLAKEMSSMSNGHPGCMTTACCYQDRLLSDKVKQVAAAILVQWRKVSLAQLREVAEHHPPSVEIDLEGLADMLPALIDGSIIFSRVVGDQSILPRQIRLYRSLVESAFKSYG